MADTDVSYTCSLGEQQCGSWSSGLNNFVNGAKPDGFTLAGSAASLVQESLDLFKSNVQAGFDDNKVLGQTIHNVLTGHHHKMVEEDKKAAELLEKENRGGGGE